MLPQAPRVTIGAVIVRDLNEKVTLPPSVWGGLRRYAIKPQDVAQLALVLNAGLLPQLRDAPGFIGYHVIDGGGGRILSLSSWTDRASAEASDTETAGWMKTNLADIVLTAPEVIFGETRVQLARPTAART